MWSYLEIGLDNANMLSKSLSNFILFYFLFENQKKKLFFCLFWCVTQIQHGKKNFFIYSIVQFYAFSLCAVMVKKWGRKENSMEEWSVWINPASYNYNKICWWEFFWKKLIETPIVKKKVKTSRKNYLLGLRRGLKFCTRWWTSL